MPNIKVLLRYSHSGAKNVILYLSLLGHFVVNIKVLLHYSHSDIKIQTLYSSFFDRFIKYKSLQLYHQGDGTMNKIFDITSPSSCTENETLRLRHTWHYLINMSAGLFVEIVLVI